MRKGLLFILFTFMLGSCAATAEYRLPQENFQTMKRLTTEAAKYCDDTLYSWNASLAAGIMPRKESFYAYLDSCLLLLREAESQATEFTGKAQTVSPKDYPMMYCYREHLKAAIAMWESFQACYEARNDPPWVRECLRLNAQSFETTKGLIWAQCRPTDDDPSDEPRTGRFSREN